ncbi:MAG: hypothetical protein ACLT3Y_01595 [Ruminococcus callidus]
MIPWEKRHERAMESTLRGTDGIKKITVENGVVVSSDMETRWRLARRFS